MSSSKERRFQWWGVAGAVATVCAVALLLRLLRMYAAFPSSDAAEIASLVRALHCGDKGLLEQLQRLGEYRLGGVQPLVTYAFAILVDALGGALSTRVWALPTILAGTFHVYLTFLLVRELLDAKAGLAAAAIVAVSPIHVLLSRSLAAPWAFELVLQTWLALCAVRVGRDPARRWPWLLHGGLAIYLWTGNQMLAVFPVLAFAFVAQWLATRGDAQPRAWLRRFFATPAVLLTVGSAALLALDTFVFDRGHLHHALFERKKEWGWYLGHWMSNLARDVGHGPTWLSVGLLCFLPALRLPVFSLLRLPAALFLAYSVPFWLFVSPKTTMTTGYVVYGINWLLVGATTVAFQLPISIRFRLVLPALTALLLLLGTFKSVWKVIHSEVPRTRPFQGSFVPDRGATTVAGWIRTHSGNSTDRVFSDASGGAGLKPPLMRYYFRRPFFALYDARRQTPYKRFRKRRNEIRYWVTKPRNRALVAQHFGSDFGRALTVVSGAKRHLDVFVRGHRGRAEDLDVERGRDLYDQAYPNMCSR